MLIGDQAADVPELPPESILVAPDLLPSQFLALDKSRLAGICTARRRTDVARRHPRRRRGHTDGCIGRRGRARRSPRARPRFSTPITGASNRTPRPPGCVRRRTLLAERRARLAADARDAHELCFTADGVRIEVFANLGSIEDAETAIAAGAEGCGLLRTEFLFLDRDAPPDEEEQRAIYSDDRHDAAGPAAGGSHARHRRATNRCPTSRSGMRRIRRSACAASALTLARPDLLATQLRAILRAVPSSQCRIMLPMVVDVDELRQARADTGRARQRLSGSVTNDLRSESWSRLPPRRCLPRRSPRKPTSCRSAPTT